MNRYFGAHQSSANVQSPSKLRTTIPPAVKKVVPIAATSTSSQERPYPAGSLLSPMKTKMQNIKKVYFCIKLFKNTIFLMYEWWRFQRYRICLKKSEIRIGIEKFNFFLVHLVRSIQTKIKLDNKLKTRKQKIVGWALSIVVCAWNVWIKLKTRKQKIVGRALSIVVFACNVRNKPKTRKQKIAGCTLVCKLFVPDVIKTEK